MNTSHARTLALAATLALAGIATAQSRNAAPKYTGAAALKSATIDQARPIPIPDVSASLSAQASDAATPGYDHENLRDAYAQELDGLVIPCPAGRGATDVAACYRVRSSPDHHRWEIDQLVDTFGDASFAQPWEAGEDFVYRLLVADTDAGKWLFGIVITEEDRHTVVWFTDHGGL